MKAQASASQGKATIESRTLSVRIDQPFARVYEFLVYPANWNKWACGHSSNKPENLIRQIGASKTSADAILPKGREDYP